MQPTPGPETLIDEGMARQLRAFTVALSVGMPRLGWKIGINAPEAQKRMGLDGPIVGWLDGRRVVEPGGTYTPPPQAKPRIEAETAILLSSDVSASATLGEARAAIASVAAAYEFVNGAKPLSPLDDLLAYDILHDAVMFGPELSLSAAKGLGKTGLPAVTLNSEAPRPALPGRYPDDLAEIVLHVAKTLEKHGQKLLAGDRIIGGSYIDPFDVAAGDRVEADFGGLGKLGVTIG